MHQLVLLVINNYYTQLKHTTQFRCLLLFYPWILISNNVRFRFIKLYVCALIARKVIKTHEKIAIRSHWSTTTFKELRTFSKIIITLQTFQSSSVNSCIVHWNVFVFWKLEMILITASQPCINNRFSTL